MATIQKRTSRGHVYWSIVESRRVNGKPRPIILAYLGRAEDLLKRLTEGIPQKSKSYSHGAVSALLGIAEELQVVETINRHLPEASKQMRDGFTVGGSLLLAALGRACKPTSKMGWYEGFARHTSLSHLLRMSLAKLDSQHFWDQMDAVPTSILPLVEEDLVQRMIEIEEVRLDTLLCDMTNFFTYIASTNEHCSLAERGRNKQKRMDLRQLGLLLLVSRQDHLPLFHKVYQGNLQDRTVFKEHLQAMLARIKAISVSMEDITLVFDQGNNSKGSLYDVDQELHFVGAASPFHHKDLIAQANPLLKKIAVAGKEVECYRTRTQIWELDLTVVVYISERLLEGQIRGITQSITKLFGVLDALMKKIRMPTSRGPKRTKQGLEDKIRDLIASHDLTGLIGWTLGDPADGVFDLAFWINEDELKALQENWLGRRILVTNRHEWSEAEILSAYWGQAQVEHAFKNLKNPFHLALRPQHHWTDKKIEVHGFTCLLAFLLSMVLYKRAKERCSFKGEPHSLLESLSAIRLSTFIENPQEKTKGPYKAVQRIEEMDQETTHLAQGLGIIDKELKTNIPLSVYN